MDQTSRTQASLQYLANTDKPPVYIAPVAGGEVTPHQGNYIVKQVDVEGVRGIEAEFDLDKEGFCFLTAPSSVSDFHDEEQINRRYEPEIESTVRALTGARRVLIFDHTRRGSSQALRESLKMREVASIVHNDYTADSGPKRLRDFLDANPGVSGDPDRDQFAIFNVWRPIKGPVLNHPLAMCDASSVSASDLVPVTRKARDRVGELQLALYNPRHRWFYLPRMLTSEAVLFKTYDSVKDGRPRFTLHSSFDDPLAPADAPPRQSIETRCFAFF